jgi:GNAT superfamily N-acetyltransferase
VGGDPVVREFRAEDVAEAAELVQALMPEHVVTRARVLHHVVQDGRGWVAVDGGELVGWAEARRRWGSSVADEGRLWVGVREESRGRGVGAGLFEQAEEYLRDLGVRRFRTYSSSEAGRRFLERRGFLRGPAVTYSALDPRTVDTSEVTQRRPDGFRLATLAELLDRPHELFDLYAATELDMPGDHALTEDDYDKWRADTLDHPDLHAGASHVVLAPDGRPVSLAWVLVDDGGVRCENEMTGTLREFRGRGLARLAKLATIRWAAEHGVNAILTSNHDENAPMLGLNRSLGYRPFVTSFDFVKGS